jgi:predicted SprT family Zn-dependent metalloprotease
MAVFKITNTIKKWQDVLNLLDWKINYKFVDFKRADNYPQKGDIKVSVKTKTATILLKKDQPNIENTIVHELVHLILWDLDHYAESRLNADQKNKYFDLLESTVKKLTDIIEKTQRQKTFEGK